ncbi:hypothetical protein GMRT_20209 [Giardia muris]|uniref:Uncharacterized protein n=1 Tax=Giardia muris TaxID=5742 RepID=A0A4Z1SX69_GIAMU|nr:hypothetical protein GMRT_20209 [Giardia muris]|eukprot:TNJ29425.1 hypothetical protein GMRT_20209 [Giardia muris]
MTESSRTTDACVKNVFCPLVHGVDLIIPPERPSPCVVEANPILATMAHPQNALLTKSVRLPLELPKGLRDDILTMPDLLPDARQLRGAEQAILFSMMSLTVFD